MASSRWKRIRDITATRLPRIGNGGTGLVDELQRVHIVIHGLVADGQNHPSNYMGHSNGEPRVRVAQKVEESSQGEADLKSLQHKEILYATTSTLS